MGPIPEWQIEKGLEIRAADQAGEKNKNDTWGGHRPKLWHACQIGWPQCPRAFLQYVGPC